MFPRSLLDADDDWQEGLRAQLYPVLHPYLDAVGGYAVGSTGWNQYVGTIAEDEDAIELELVDVGFRRNPIACFKSLPDGRRSEGSWVLLPEDAPDYVAPGMQLHVTLFEVEDPEEGAGREVYAHYEDDWRASPFAHLRGKNFNPAAGVDIATDYLNDQTFLTVQDQG